MLMRYPSRLEWLDRLAYLFTLAKATCGVVFLGFVLFCGARLLVRTVAARGGVTKGG